MQHFSEECVDINSLCDGVRDCIDGSDENPSNCDLSDDLEIRLIDPSISLGDFTNFETEPVKKGRVEIKHNVRYLSTFWYSLVIHYLLSTFIYNTILPDLETLFTNSFFISGNLGHSLRRLLWN